MLTIEQLSVQIPKTSAQVLENTDWYTEQSFYSREPVFIHGLIGKQVVGQLNGHLVIEREIEGEHFIEKGRYVRLNDVCVHQLEGIKMKRRRLGMSMVQELEKMAIEFGAEKIIGMISASDLLRQPWLPKFYKQLGFTVTENGDGFNLEKSLE